MANGDNPKVQVDVDLEGAYRQGQQWGENFNRGVNNKMGEGGIGGQVLGSGLSSLGPGSGLSIAVTLNNILTALENGFGNLVAAVGGGASAAPPGASARTGAPPPPADGGGGGSGGMPSGGGFGGRALATIDRSLPAIANMVQTEFHRTGVYQALNAAFGDIPIVGKLFGIGADYSQASDEFLNTSLNVFRAGGRDSRAGFRNMGDFKEGQTFLKRHGVTMQEAGNLYQAAASYGSDAADPLITLQGRYGLGDKGRDLMSAYVQGGAEPDVKFKKGENEWKNFGDVLAVALATNLDRGRWGEAFTAMTAAARRISTGDIDKQGLVEMETFIGKMGSRFQGASTAHMGMQETLMGMQGGAGGGLAEIYALKAAGLGQPGVSYWEAKHRVNLGAAKGGVGLNDLIKQYKSNPLVAKYMATGSERDLNIAYQIIAGMEPQFKPMDIREALRAMRVQGGAFAPGDRLRAGMERQLHGTWEGTAFGGTDFMPSQEKDASDARVNASFKGVDFTTRMDRDENYSGRSGGGIGGIENLDEANQQGLLRTGADVEFVKGDGGMEGYGDERQVWPRKPGDSEPEVKGKPGYRRARPGERHFARDITIGNGAPGQKVYAPMSGVWLTNTHVLANRKVPQQGHIGEMLGDNGVRYKFIHLYFEPGLKKNKRIEAGELIGTVAEGTAGWTPHLHLEARRRGAGGKASVVDPQTTGIDASARDIMSGKTPIAKPTTPSTAPVFEDDGKPITDPDKVVPVSSLDPGHLHGDAVAVSGRGGGGGPGAIQVTVNLSPEARRLLNLTVMRKPATKKGSSHS